MKLMWLRSLSFLSMEKFVLLVLYVSLVRHSSAANDQKIANEAEQIKNIEATDSQLKLTLRTSSDDNPVQLTMTRSAAIAGNPMTLIGRNGQVENWKATPGQELTSYVDLEHQAAVVVDRSSAGTDPSTMRYRGTFRSGRYNYDLSPNDRLRFRRQVSNSRSGPAHNRIHDIDHVVYPSVTSADSVYAYGTYSQPDQQKRFIPEPISGQAEVTSSTSDERRRVRRSGSSRRPKPLGTGYNRNDGQKQQYIVEVVIIIDFALYQSWYRDSRAKTDYGKQQEAIAMARHYYAAVASGIDARYASINEPDFSIRIRLVGFFIATTPEDSPWTEDPSVKIVYEGETFVDMYKGLAILKQWVANLTSSFTPFDHAILYTGNYLFDGRFDGDGRPQIKSGLADMDGICDKRLRVSINYENGQYSSIQTGAHELGHNLGARHDGSKVTNGNSCDSLDQFIMSSSPGLLDDNNFQNTFSFSPCSIQYFREFLSELTRSGSNCLLYESAKSTLSVDHVYPGLVYTADAQCHFFEENKASFFCGGALLEKKMCSLMLCWNVEQNDCLASAEQRAFVGTPCGNRKWCMRGECVASDEAPPSNETCIYGDYRGPVYIDDAIPTMTCAEAGRLHPWKCYDDVHVEDCCKTCEAIRKVEQPDCEYGDRRPDYCRQPELTRADCYDDTFAQTCCGTCARFRKESVNAMTSRTRADDCTYGDRASWCQLMTLDRSESWQCYAQSDTCCETCRDMYTGIKGCEYGDHVNWCRDVQLTADRCRPDDLGVDCCHSCRQLLPDIGSSSSNVDVSAAD